MDQDLLQANYFNLYMVRHGKSVGNHYQLLGGWTDVPLVEEGREELRALKAQIPYPEADLYIHSGLARAKETLAIITGKENEARSDWRFSETYYGMIEATPQENDAKKDFFLNFYQGKYQGYGEETFADQARRTKLGSLDILRELASKNLNSSYIFCHYGTIQNNIVNFSDLTVEDMLQHWIPNGSLWHFLFKENAGHPDGFTCRLIRGYYPHFETNELVVQTFLDVDRFGDQKAILS